MADFNTHVFSAAALVSIGATAATKLLSLTITEGISLMLAGMIGGVLPDIDLPRSKPSKALFTALGIVAGLIWMFSSMSRYTGLELWLGVISILLLSRFLLAVLFQRVTRHRGVLHSLIAAVMAGVITCAICWSYIGSSALQSWLAGLFMLAGYLIHLSLDEIYSVNFAGAQLKRSFGSALKPVDMQQRAASVIVVLITLAAAFWCAPYSQALEQLTERYSDWRHALIPEWIG